VCVCVCVCVVCVWYVCVCVCGVCLYETAAVPTVYYFSYNLLIQLKIPDTK